MAEVQTGTKPKAAALLTGFETALGRSAAVALARAGHRLCVIRCDGGSLELGDLPGHEQLQHHGIALDLADAGAAPRALAEALARLGQITALVHVPAPLLEPPPESFDSQRFGRLLQRGPGAFLALGLGLLPEMFATQTGSLCVLTSAPAPESSFASSEVGAAALLGGLLGAVKQLADRCAGTPLRSFLLHTTEPSTTALSASAQRTFAAQFADWGEQPPSQRSPEAALLENGDRASLAAAGSRAPIELFSAPVVAPGTLGAAEAARVAQVALGGGAVAPNGSAAGPDRIAERLGQTFRSVFGLAPSVDLGGCVVGSVPRWDSLGHLKLMMEVERALRVRLPAEALAKIQSYRDLERAVRAQLSTL
jgi:NAD(P)-dependent dehydrogenase (short-subunit alcohol dehydrogenase family)